MLGHHGAGMSRYRKIEVAMWRDARFMALSQPQPNGQTLWTYLLCGPRTTTFPGLVVAREAVMADDLGWSLEGFREAFGEVSREGLVEADWRVGVVILKKALLDGSGDPRDTARPESPNVIRSWAKSWSDIPSCELTSKYLDTLKLACEALGGGFPQAFLEAFRKAYRHPTPNQEQEQEQDIERKKISPPARVLEAQKLAEVAVGEINRLSGSRYRADSENTQRDCVKLAKGQTTPAQVLEVIRSKRDWIGDEKMGRQFKPSVLLRPSNFRRYLEDLEARKPKRSEPSPDEPPEIRGFGLEVVR